MSRTIEEILAPKPEARPRIYAYSIDDKAHRGLLKVGQTARDVIKTPEQPGKRRIMDGCDPMFSPVTVPSLAHVAGRCVG